MKIKHFLILLLLHQSTAFAQHEVIITGSISDSQTNERLAGATIAVKGTTIATTSDANGIYFLRTTGKGKISLIVSHIGYSTTELPLFITDMDSSVINVSLNMANTTGEQIVVSASKRSEKITNAPAAIQLITSKDIEQYAGSNTNEMFSKVLGLEYTRSGVDEITFNARGLNSAFNNKVFEIVDGRNSMAAASAGLALFNNGSTIKNDIDQIEIVLGPQSALYGPNAHNALINYITKDPRKYPGTSVSFMAGSQQQFSGAFRHAEKINNHWAYKFTGGFETGKDYTWYDSVYAGNQPPGNTPFYGKPVAIPELINNFTFQRQRGEAHLYYSIAKNEDIILSTGGSKFTRIQVTTSGRNQLRDVTYVFLQARYVHPHFFATVYNTWGDLGNSLLLGNYTRDFWNRTHSTLQTGPNRYLAPDSAKLFASRLGNTIKEESQRLNGEFQYNNQFQKAGLNIVGGLSFQKDLPNGFGISLIDSFEKIRITQVGAVLQLDKNLPWKLRLVSTVRVDHHSNMGYFFAPRFAILKPIGNGNFRISWGRAYAVPSIQNQYAGINRFLFGNGKGIEYIPNGTNIQNSKTYIRTDPLRPEEVNTFETGYKGKITSRLYIDINYYNGLSKNFISPARSVSGRAISVNGIKVTQNAAFAGSIKNDTLKNASFLTFFNYGNVRAYGLDAGLSYDFNKYFHFTLNYSWFGSDITKDNLKNDANKDGYVSAEEKTLNAPSNRIIGILGFQNLWRNKLFVIVSVRYVSQYDFYSGNQIGTQEGMGKRGVIDIPGKPSLLKNFDWGPLGGFTTFGLESGYKISNVLSVNTTVTNLLNTRQVEFVGSPSIGRLIMVELKIHVPSPIKK